MKLFYIMNGITGFKVFFLIILIFIAAFSLSMISGGVTDDTYNYIRSSIALPWLKSSVFPPCYPLAIKFINYFVNDFFFTTRIVSFLGLLSIGIMSFYFKFFTKETVLVLGMKIFTLFLYAVSETLFLPVFYAFLMGVHLIIQGKKDFLSVAFTTISLISLFAIRYSGLFVWGSLGAFIMVRFFFSNRKEVQVNRTILMVLLFSMMGIIMILIYNFLLTYAVFGENNRNPTLARGFFDFAFFLKSIFFSFFMAGNPISDAIRINTFTFLFSIMVSALFWGFLIYNYWIHRKKIFKNQFLVFLFITAAVYLVGILYASYSTGIDGLHLRLSLPVIFCLFLILVIINKNSKVFLLIAVISIAINAFLFTNESFDYVEKKKNVTNFLHQKHSLKYYYNDVGKVPTETGGTKSSNFFTLFSLNPGVVELSDKEVKTVVNDSVIFESEMVQIIPVNRTNMINNKTFTQ